MKHVQLHQQEKRKKKSLKQKTTSAQQRQGLQAIPDSCTPPNPVPASTPPSLLQLKILPKSQNPVPFLHIANGTYKQQRSYHFVLVLESDRGLGAPNKNLLRVHLRANREAWVHRAGGPEEKVRSGDVTEAPWCRGRI